jgi:uncharacterized protein
VSTDSDPGTGTVRRPGPVRWAFPGALVAVLLLWNNVVVPWLPGSTAVYVGGNLTAAVVLVALARWTGLSWAELGLSPRRLPAGLVWGGACFLAIAGAYAVGVAVPGLRPLLADARAADADLVEVAEDVLVRIPLGTVLWEEVAFRGVLLAALIRVLPVRRAAVVAAVVFGLWHVRPTLSGLSANDLADGPALRALAVLGVCVFTAVAGLLFTWLRLRSGSLLAPVLLHLATNSLGTVAATVVGRLG